MDSRRGLSPTPWILPPSRRPSPRLRIFCFPSAGTGGSAVRDWSDALPPDLEVCAVQPPGREERWAEPPYRRLSGLVREAAAALRPHLDIPFALFGHSMGALIAFELARYLRQRGDPLPVRLFVSACGAAHRPRPHPPVHRLPDTELVEEIHRRYDGIPAAVLENAELLQLLLPLLWADFELVEDYAYRPGGPLDCPISCFGGRQDQHVSLDDLEAWRDQTRGVFTVRLFPGGHFFTQSARRAVLQALVGELRAGSGRPPADVS